MLEHFFKSLVATVSDPYQCNRITDALAAAGIKFYCKSKDVNRHNTFDQARIGTLGIKPRYVTEVFVDKENVATVYKGNIIKNLIMDCQSYTKYRPNETTGGIFVSWRRKEELPTGA